MPEEILTRCCICNKPLPDYDPGDNESYLAPPPPLCSERCKKAKEFYPNIEYEERRRRAGIMKWKEKWNKGFDWIVDWSAIRIAYQKRRGVLYTSMHKFIKEVYRRTGSTHRMAKELSVSSATVNRKLHEEGIEIQKRGGSYRPSPFQDKLLKIDPKKIEVMTATEISGKLGCSESRARALLNKNNLKWRKLKSRGKHKRRA